MPNIAGSVVGFMHKSESRYSALLLSEAGTEFMLTLYIPNDTLDLEFIERAFASSNDVFAETDDNGVVKTLCFTEEGEQDDD